MTLSVPEAFDKFRQHLEIRPAEQKDASLRQNEIREVMREVFALERDILTGSYARATKIRPLEDVDIFCILDQEEERKYLSSHPSLLLQEVAGALRRHFPDEDVMPRRRSVKVDFSRGGPPGEERILSFDVVPAFARGRAYVIPDTVAPEQWIRTDPEIHAEKATAANEAFQKQWKPMVKMIKKWNANQGKPIKPSFLIEVMAHQILAPPFSGGYAREVKSFLATAHDRLDEDWDDPAGLGPPVSDQMDAASVTEARRKILEASRAIDHAIFVERDGKIGQALRAWRDRVFGPFFPLS